MVLNSLLHRIHHRKKLFQSAFSLLLLILLTLSFHYSCQKIEPERLVKLKTGSITDISYTFCSVQGTLLDIGNSYIKQHGFCWSVAQNPTIENDKTELGKKLYAGDFSSGLYNLSVFTTYYIKAYAKDQDDIVYYGEEKSFLTSKYYLPTVNTAAVTEITEFSATCGGNVTDDGYSFIIDKGVCWNTSPGPTVENNTTSAGDDKGSFISLLGGLKVQTTYYVKAYATNEAGTAYGQEVSFTTKSFTGSFIDNRDEHTYNWVEINGQKWMSENLAYLPEVSPSNVSSYNTPQYYIYDYQGNNMEDAKASSNYSVYGVLYNWTAAMAGAKSNDANPGAIQGVCPDGWHLPSDSEWKELEIFLGMSPSDANLTGQRGDIGGKLKEEGTEHWSHPNTGATNSSSFIALPGGKRNYDSNFTSMKYLGCWWTSTEYDVTYAYSRTLDYAFTSVYRDYPNKDQGLSVRCIEGRGAHLPEVTTNTPEDVTQDGATVGGIVLDDGYATVTERGIYYGTNTSPQYTGTKYVMGSGDGPFSADLTGLTTGLTYYVIAYATNVAGTAYGEVLSFVPKAR